MADKRVKSGGNDKKRATESDEMTNTNFSYNLDACLVQGSRGDRDATPTGPGVVERVWVTSRPPTLGHGVEPTVSARRAYVMLTHVQGQIIDTGELVCKRVCTTGGGGKEDNSVNTAAQNPTKTGACTAAGGIGCD